MKFDITPVKHPLSIREKKTGNAGKADSPHFPNINFNTLILCIGHHSGGDADISIDEPTQDDGLPVIEIPEVCSHGE